MNESQFLAGIADADHREPVAELVEVCRTLRLGFEWRTTGTSIRLPTVDRPEPLTIVWLFPPRTVGWMGLTDLTLGFDPSSAEKSPSIADALAAYLDTAARCPEWSQQKPPWLRAYHLSPRSLVACRQHVQDALIQLVQDASGT